MTGYQIYRCQGSGCSNFALLTTTSADQLQGHGPGAEYQLQLRVRALDAAGNQGTFSNTAAATTDASADTQAPSAPGTLSATAASTSRIDLSAGARPATTWRRRLSDLPLHGCRLQQLHAAAHPRSPVPPTTTTVSPPARATATRSAPSTPPATRRVLQHRLRSHPDPGDTQSPSRPARSRPPLRARRDRPQSWGAATDNVGVTGYQVYAAGRRLQQLRADRRRPRHDLQGHQPHAGTSYSYGVRAVDAAGNLGAFSNAARATTQTRRPQPVWSPRTRSTRARARRSPTRPATATRHDREHNLGERRASSAARSSSTAQRAGQRSRLDLAAADHRR